MNFLFLLMASKYMNNRKMVQWAMVVPTQCFGYRAVSVTLYAMMTLLYHFV